MTKTEKHQSLIKDCISKMNGDDQQTYRPIAEYALELGYTPKLLKKENDTSGELAFSKSKVSRTLLRIRPMYLKPPKNYQIHQAGKAQLRLCFFATPAYSEPFRFGVKNVIEAFDFKYTGCYGCGRCNGDLQGYTYIYPDGKKVFRCGGQLIELPPIGEEHVGEIKAMMKVQDEFWMKGILS